MGATQMLDALAWICGEGQRACYAISASDGDLPLCVEDDPTNPELWCDVCLAGAVWFTEVTGVMCCESCSHLRREHTGSAGECDCCRCPSFVAEPDDLMASGSPSGEQL